MPLSKLIRWFRPATTRRPVVRSTPHLTRLEARDVPAGYVAIGAGPGGLPAVSIRVDIQDALGGSGANGLGQPSTPRSNGKTDFTSQTFYPFGTAFRGGVKVATGNFDGLYGTSDSLVTAAGPGGGPHVIVWNTRENADGTIVVTGIRDQFFAYDARFRGGVSITTGDLDGDGKAELITGAGPGGGPHVRVWKEIGGRFQVVNEFFAFDASFKGGVNVASGQGYRTVTQQRYVLDDQLPDTFQLTPYTNPSLVPGALLQVPLQGFDFAVNAGGNTFVGPNGGLTTPFQITGNFDDNDQPLPYFTVASGSLQYNSGNLLSAWGNIEYKPGISPNTNDPDIGSLVLAKWTQGGMNFPGAPFQTEVDYGPFKVVGKITTPDGQVPLIARLTQSPDQVTFKNQLVIGAGPGGGPHVRIFDFSGTAGGSLVNNGVGKEFFAFDASFRGGVTVAINDVLAHQDAASRSPGRIDYTQSPPQFILDTTNNAGSQAYFNYPYDTELNRRYQADIVVGMQSRGSEVRVFADFNPKTTDPLSQYSSPTPSRRTSLSQLNLVPFNIDTVVGVNPNDPLQGGYVGTTVSGTFRRAISNGATYDGGVNVSTGSLNFIGSGETRFINEHTQPPLQASSRPVDPVLGQIMFSPNGQTASAVNSASRVRIFNSVAPYAPTGSTINGYYEDAYFPVDDFQAFPADPNARGASVAFGYGVLPEPGINVTYASNSGPNGAVTSNTATLHSIMTLTDPIFLPGG